MKKIISEKITGLILIVLISLLTLFHLLILLKIIPYDFIWGGSISDDTAMYKLESFSLLISIAMIVITILKLKYKKQSVFRIIINVIVWILFAYFALMILANFASKALLEKIIFGSLSIVFALLTLRLAIEK